MNLKFSHNGERSTHGRFDSVGPRVAFLGGGALAAYGLSRKSLTGAALAAVGTYGAVAGVRRGARPATAVHVQKTFTVNRPAEELYDYWHNFENLPPFMKNLKSVTTKGRNSRWVANGPMGVPIEWDAELIEEKPGEYLVWRSLPGSTVSHRGSVEFRPAPNGSGTEITVAITYRSPGGKMSAVFAKLFGREPEQQVREDLRRFKALMEAGEIPTVVGQSSGRRSTVVKMLHALKEPEATQRVRKGPRRQTRAASLKPQFTGTEMGGVR